MKGLGRPAALTRATFCTMNGVSRSTSNRSAVVSQKIAVVLCETATVIQDHAFTTGKIKRNSMERILPNTFVDYAQKDGEACNYGHYTAAELQGKIQPDQHVHEHATCFN